jgi:hypothetical protein
MDYAKDDIARPAAIPGWSGINYSTGQSSAGQFCLNDVKVGPKAFKAYSQTLNLHEGTLTTSYRYTDASNKSTDIKVVTFASQAAPHLAATRISITPDFSGTVQLAFPFLLWAPHEPRFSIRTMTGDEMLAAVAAHNMTVLEPINHATPDRAPVWYHGYTNVTRKGGERTDLTLWLDGRAEQGLSMAEAAAIGIPAELTPSDVRLVDTPYQLGLLLSVPVPPELGPYATAACLCLSKICSAAYCSSMMVLPSRISPEAILASASSIVSSNTSMSSSSTPPPALTRCAEVYWATKKCRISVTDPGDM